MESGMRRPKVLLISADVSVGQAVDNLFCSHPRLTCKTVSQHDEAPLYVQAGYAVLLIIHLRRKDDTVEVRRLLHRLMARGRSLATVLLHEPYLEAQVAELRKDGCVECLSRPFNWSRI